MNKEARKSLLGAFVLLTGILFVVCGICRQEHKTVGQKSNLICLECIGIG